MDTVIKKSQETEQRMFKQSIQPDPVHQAMLQQHQSSLNRDEIKEVATRICESKAKERRRFIENTLEEIEKKEKQKVI